MSRGPRASDVRRDWGHDETGCAILHVDMDAFFASVEVMRNPDLAGRPVLVGGGERGVVLAATYEARAYGVHSAMPMALARRRCPQAVVVPPDHRRYTEVSRAVMAILREITALVEQVSIDEAFLDVAGARRRLGPPTVIASALRERIRREVGVTCSVGIAATKFVAKLASTHAKPDGMLLVPAAATIRFLRLLPVGALWGVGERTEQQLARWGIATVAELADADLHVVQRAVGAAAGARLHDLAWGRDPRPVQPHRTEHSMGAETTFGSDQSDLRVVQRQLLQLADQCATRLRRQGVVAKTVTVKVRTADFRTVTRARTLLSPTDVAQEIYLTARDLVAEVDLRGLPVRLVGVRVENLVERADAVVQLTLDEANRGEPEARRSVERAVDLVRDRFGQTAIQFGPDKVASTSSPVEVDLS